MTPKEFLMQIRLAEILIKNKKEQLEALASSAIYQSPSLSERVQSSSNPNKQMDLLLKICDLQQEINVEISRLIDIKVKVMKCIDRIKNSEYVDILYRRYINNQQWEKIALDTNYNIRTVYKIHGQALVDLEKIMEKENIK